MGSVYEATHIVMDRSVAIKVLHATDGAGVKRFEREARALSSIKNPAIPEFYGWGVTPAGCPYLVMEFIDYPSLTELVGEHGTLPAQTVRQIGVAACQALSAIHQAGLVHRDIKPDNLMVQSLPDGTVKVKVTDLGIARATAAMGTTQTQSVVGSIAYMSPEHYSPAALEGRSDLFSLGCVLYRCLAGHAPYEGETALAAALKMRENERDPLPDSVPAYLRHAVDRCLAVDPTERFASAEDLQEALRSENIVPFKAVRSRKQKKSLPVGLKWLTLLAVLAVVPACFFVFSNWQQKQNEPTLEDDPLYKTALEIPFSQDPTLELSWIKEHYHDPKMVTALLRLRYKDNLANGRITRALTQHRQLGVHLRDEGFLRESFEELLAALKEAQDNKELKNISLAKTQMELGKTAFMRKDYEDAHKMLDQALQILDQEEPGGEARAEGSLQRAQIHEFNGEPLRYAKKDYEVALEIFRDRFSFDKEFTCLDGLLRVKAKMHDNSDLPALRERFKVLSLDKHHQLVLAKANCQDFRNSNKLPPLADMISTVQYFDHHGLNRDPDSLASLSLRIAHAYKRQGKRAESSKWYQASIKYTDEIPLKIHRLNALNLCLMELIHFDQPRAVELAEKIMKVLTTEDPRPDIGDVSVSPLFYRDFSTSLADMLTVKISAARPLALQLADIVKKRSQSAAPDHPSDAERLVYINCCLELNNALGEDQATLPYLEQALQMVSEMPPQIQRIDIDELARFWQDAASVYLGAGQSEKAVEASMTGYKLNRPEQSDLAKAVTARNIADTLTKTGRRTEAGPYLLESRAVTLRMLETAQGYALQTESLRLTDWSACALISYYIALHDLTNARQVCHDQEAVWKRAGRESEQSFSVKQLIRYLDLAESSAPKASTQTSAVD